ESGGRRGCAGVPVPLVGPLAPFGTAAAVSPGTDGLNTGAATVPMRGMVVRKPGPLASSCRAGSAGWTGGNGDAACGAGSGGGGPAGGGAALAGSALGAAGAWAD